MLEIPLVVLASVADSGDFMPPGCRDPHSLWHPVAFEKTKFINKFNEPHKESKNHKVT